MNLKDDMSGKFFYRLVFRLTQSKKTMNKVLCETPSSDENIEITLDDIFKPWFRGIREKMRRLK